MDAEHTSKEVLYDYHGALDCGHGWALGIAAYNAERRGLTRAHVEEIVGRSKVVELRTSKANTASGAEGAAIPSFIIAVTR